MKTKLICLLLCLVFILSAVLTGCKSKSDDEAIDETVDKASESAVTLTMWVVTENEDGVDAETAASINEAVNLITNSKFKTRLVLSFLTEAEYRSTLDATIRAYEVNRGAQVVEEEPTEEETTAPVEDETVTNEWGITTIKYPELIANQVDIIYIQGQDMYFEYVENEWLSALDTELTSSSKKIKEYVSAQLLAAAKHNGSTYAIPNNHTIGEYTFMLLDKALMQETSTDAVYQQGKINGFFNDYVYTFLKTVRNKPSGTALPIAATYEECLALLAHFWSINPDTLENENTLSLIGSYIANDSSLNRSSVLGFNSLFTNQDFVTQFLRLNEFKLDGGYFGTPAEGQTAAVKFATGSYEDYIAYKADSSAYYPVIVKNPTVTAEDVYSSMFGVCTYTRSLSRSMEIVTYLNTNADFRNLIQYGVEDVNYRLVENADNTGKEIEIIGDKPYKMGLFKTGNVFIAYPEPGKSADIWKNGKLQNLDVPGAEPLLDFNFADVAAATQTKTAVPTSTANVSYSYSAGFSKEILAQNGVLKAWMENADAKGKGVYAYVASKTSGQNVTSDVYLYNNDIANGTFSLDVTDTAVTYQFENQSGDGATPGYLLAHVSLSYKKNAKFVTACSVNGSVVSFAGVTNQSSALSFDFLNTETYQIRANLGITKASISSYAPVWDWMKALSPVGGTSYALTYTKTLADGRKLCTYLVYSTGIANTSSLFIHPTGSKTDVTVNIDFNDTTKALGATDPTYSLWQVTVLADASVNSVKFNVNRNGAPASVSETVAATDPGFNYCGTLNHQVVRFMYDLNGAIVAKLNACTTIDQMKALISEIQTLMTTTTVSKASDFTFLADVVSGKNMELMNYYFQVMTSNAAVKYMVDGFDEDSGEPIKVEVETDSISGEKLVKFDSPYQIYYAWLQSNGYISKK